MKIAVVGHSLIHESQAYYDFMSTEERLEMAWLAGIIDGEGTISITPGDQIFISITLTHRPTLERIRTIAGTGKIYSEREADSQRKATFVWKAHSRQAAAILRRCVFFLYLKKDRAQLALEFQKNVGLTRIIPSGGKIIPRSAEQERARIKEELKTLNRKGPI